MADQLCESCSQLDILELFSGPRGPYCHSQSAFESGSEQSQVFVDNLSVILANQDCPFCRLIAFALRTPHSGLLPEMTNVADVNCYLEPWRACDRRYGVQLVDPRAKNYTASHLVIRWRPMFKNVKLATRGSFLDIALLQEIGQAFQVPSRPLLNGARLPNYAMDFQMVDDWMAECQSLHSHCRDTQRNVSSKYLESFRLIDVSRRNLVRCDPRMNEYFALSYVWGRSLEEYLDNQTGSSEHRNSSEEEKLPANLPQTIEDALTICEKFEIPYLWVDLYCIDQSDDKIKAVQIQNLTYTFHLAKMTIIAAAGKDPHCGLSRLREGWPSPSSSQLAECVHGLQLITTLPGLGRQFDNSDLPWLRRGWTYQEAYFSKRCLVFGDLDLSRICGENYWQECINSWPYHPCDGSNNPIETTYLKQKTVWCMCRGFRDTSKWTFNSFQRLILESTRRAFTKESNSLHALEAYMSLASVPELVHFRYGIPILDGLDGFLWSAHWLDPERPSRRAMFSSWTWVGWSWSTGSFSERSTRPIWSWQVDYRLRSFRVTSQDDLSRLQQPLRTSSVAIRSICTRRPVTLEPLLD